MKIKLIFIFLVILNISSCDPPNLFWNSGTFSIKAKISNISDSINPGDSIYVDFEIPDTISINGTTVNLTSKESCDLAMSIYLADSTRNAGFRNLNPDGKFYANPGKVSNGGIQFNQSAGRCWGRLYVIPRERGVYIISCSSVGYFIGNNDELYARVIYDFDVTNKHYYLLKPAIGQNHDLDPWIQSMESNGQGIYVFAVK